MTKRKKHTFHSAEFKAEALKLSEKVGVAAATKQLSLADSQIYAWRKAAKHDWREGIKQLAQQLKKRNQGYA